MDALEYLEIKGMISRNMKTCGGCYLEGCYEYETDNPQKAIELVQKWKETHSFTYEDKLRCALPYASDRFINKIIEGYCVNDVFGNANMACERADRACSFCWSMEAER